MHVAPSSASFCLLFLSPQFHRLFLWLVLIRWNARALNSLYKRYMVSKCAAQLSHSFHLTNASSGLGAVSSGPLCYTSPVCRHPVCTRHRILGLECRQREIRKRAGVFFTGSIGVPVVYNTGEINDFILRPDLKMLALPYCSCGLRIIRFVLTIEFQIERAASAIFLSH